MEEILLIVLADFICNLKTQVFALMQIAQPIGEEVFGLPNKGKTNK